jgi:hypothetical protein
MWVLHGSACCENFRLRSYGRHAVLLYPMIPGLSFETQAVLRHMSSETTSHFHQNAAFTIKVNLSQCHRTSQFCVDNLATISPSSGGADFNFCLRLRLLITILNRRKILKQYLKVGHNISSVTYHHASASYSGGPGFKPRPGDRLPWVKLSILFLDPSNEMSEWYLKHDDGHCFPCPFNFIFENHLTFVAT